jgi:tetratricopeptide (TPR) repeat protein
MILLNIGVLALVALGVWWLTGFDKTAGGESKRTHYISRVIRCVAVVWLAGIFLWFIEAPNPGLGGIPLLMILPPTLALLLRSSLAELVTHGFLRLVDPNLHDDRPLDPRKSERYMDTIAHLIKNGRRAEAIKLCEELKLSGEVERATLEMTLDFLGVKQTRASAVTPLAEAANLRAQGKFVEAEKLLKTLLAKNPADVGAAMLLVRLYAESMRQSSQAHAVLRKLEKQPHVAASHVEFARRSIDEWSRRKPEKLRVTETAESVDELLAQGFYGTAIEKLEQRAAAQPADFAVRLKLAEAHGRFSGNHQRAEKIIRELEGNPTFTAAQIQQAKTQLKEWRDGGIHGK